MTYSWDVYCNLSDVVEDSGTETTQALAKTESRTALATSMAADSYDLLRTVTNDDDSEVVGLERQTKV